MRRRGAQLVIEKHFINHERELMLFANRIQLLGFGNAHEVSGGIIGMDKQNSASARTDRGTNALKIDLPAVVVDELKRPKLHILNSSEKIKERIYGPPHQHFIAGVAEQTKKKRIGLARSCGQQEMFGIDPRARHFLFVVANDGFACIQQSFWLRIVMQGGRAAQRAQNGNSVVFEATRRGVRRRKIEEMV